MEEERSIERLHKFAQYCKVHGKVKRISDFENKCGLGQHYITNMLRKGKGSVGSDVMSRVFNIFPELNLEWLITGQGEMIKPGESDPVMDAYKKAYSTAFREAYKKAYKEAVNDSKMILKVK